MIDLLLQAGASVNAPRAGGMTPLYQSVASGRPDIAQRLIDGGASVSTRTSLQDTPLHIFAERGFLKGSGESIRGMSKPLTFCF